ncbi:MAG TPA: zinc-ribbon domain-containing protein [Dehalococcoidia bacterium]
MPFCPNCGKEVSEGITFCPNCGQRLKVGVTPENTSGQGESSIVPEEVKGWNWGAFALNWIWGICNGVLIALLCFIPGFGFVWAFVLGVKGNEWAWRNKKWDSIEQFKSTQRGWNIAGIIIFAISIAILVAIIPTVFIPLVLFCSG